jgi:hypothetical protein
VQPSPEKTPYDALKQRIARGWNTWNTRSVLSHVLLPEGIAINLGLKEYRERTYLSETLIGRRGQGVEVVTPGVRSYDGRYTDVTVQWKGITVRVQSATDEDDLLLLITPSLPSPTGRRRLLFKGRSSGTGAVSFVKKEKDCSGRHRPEFKTYGSRKGRRLLRSLIPISSPKVPYLAFSLADTPIALFTGEAQRSRADIEVVMQERVHEQEQYARGRFADLAETYRAMQTCLAWNTVYDPLKDRVISPVSRIWNCGWGGYVLFCWDTYFAAAMAAIDNRDLAYANAIEITREITESGFVPNFATVCDLTSYDRSQPPVGAMIVLGLYRTFGDRWLPNCCSTTFCAGTGGGIQRGARASFFAGGPTRTYRASARTSRRRRWITRSAR